MSKEIFEAVYEMLYIKLFPARGFVHVKCKKVTS